MYEEIARRRNTLTVLQNFPNPFKDSTSISFALQEVAHVLAIIFKYDKDEKKEIGVRRLVDKDMPSGANIVVWNGTDNEGRNLPPGRYLCRFLRPFVYKQDPYITIAMEKIN